MDTFCKIANKELPATILYEDEYFMAILDIDPHTEGHTLIIPKKHIRNMSELSLESMVNIFHYINKREKELYDMDYDSIMMRINMGKAQEIPHLHIHMWGEKTAQ